MKRKSEGGVTGVVFFRNEQLLTVFVRSNGVTLQSSTHLHKKEKEGVSSKGGDYVISLHYGCVVSNAYTYDMLSHSWEYSNARSSTSLLAGKDAFVEEDTSSCV